MAAYKEIKGINVQNVSSDPTELVGQMWYNSSTTALKAYLETTEGWSTIPSLNTPRSNLNVGGAGDSTAGLATGGWPSGDAVKTEEFNGSTWSAEEDMSNGSYRRATFGTQTAAVCASGGNPLQGTTEEYDGSSWGSGGTSPVVRGITAGAGTLTAGLQTGGNNPSNITSQVAEYDGSSWTSATSMPGGMYKHSSLGTQTAAGMGGCAPHPMTLPSASFVEYDGTNWTSGGNLPGNASYNKGASGTQTAGLYAMETSPSDYHTLKYNGSSWSEGPTTPANVGNTGVSSNTAGGNNTFLVGGSTALSFDTGGVKTKTITIS